MKEQPTSDEQFAVGEIVVVLPSLPGNYVAEGIVQYLPTQDGQRDWADRWIDPGRYGVRLVNGIECQVYPWQLRKKRPPREDLKLVRWSECPWKPQQVQA